MQKLDDVLKAHRQRPPAGPDASEQSEKNISAASNSKTKDAVNGSSEPSTVPELSHVSHDSPIDALDDATLEQILYGGRPATSQQTGGLTAAQEDALYREGTIPSPDEAEVSVGSPERVTANSIQPAQAGDIRNPGLKFDLPKKPYPEGFQMKQRYHPVLEQLTRLLMRDGKLSVAQRNVAMVMNFLRTAPAPIYSPKFPLLPGTPPASHLPLNPVLYITIAIDSVAPLLRVRNIAGAGGGGRALELPVPLAIRQRRREAIKWILDVIEKKPSKGSGRKQFPHRIAEEIIAVVEGRSGVWEKRKQVHKLGTAARANIGSRKLKTKKKM
ncbi:30S ribosomal protein S7 [Moelleriella libera RCEF 2490]|uniref:Small ribosomal subunit protein uS7m n=1 Tax=Moelleriella libera RCEF 2490 TaxID=1081109 RepID=A0A162IP95_9HYPO|nr:30S ribosomal protein S7 [Moelleriella libera RCEF 2490]